MARIVEIRLTGDGLEDALIRFEPGPNVVTGDSDTGKSYLLRLIDYVLGAKELTKIIDEASDYGTAWLEFADERGAPLTLERHLTGGNVRAYPRTIEEVLLEIRSANPNDQALVPGDAEKLLWSRQGKSVQPDVTSKVFPLFGMPENVMVRANADGETQRLSIRTLLPIVLVDEESIITEGSPILRSGFSQTPEKRMFSYVLTGKDDRGIVQRESRETVSARIQAQRDLIDELLAPLNERLKDRVESEEDRSIDQLEDTIGSLSDALAANTGQRSRLRQRRAENYQLVLKSETQIAAVDGLLTRYRLLDERYVSDLQRLDFIAESAHYYDALQESVCPMCDQAFGGQEHHHPEGAKFKAEEVHASASAEAAKIRGLQADLKSTIRDLVERDEYWRVQKETASKALEIIDHQLDSALAPARATVRNSLNELVQKRLELESARAARLEASRLAELKARLDQELSQPATKSTWAGLDPMALTDLCREIEGVLKEWSWKDDVRVEFQEDRYDIKVNGKLRRSHGKGFRAVMHAAMTIAILRYCKKNGTPHSGFVVLDSPLTTVKQRSGQTAAEVAEKDQILPAIELSFWESLAKTDPSVQVIVLDNKEPPLDLLNELNVQLFVGPDGAGSGLRAGFVPPNR
ncbi:hypothetical protein M2418_003665 [Rhizobium sp. BIGb0125]|uniref:hypothetical protein n=1 Tax=Rhizobium sp. BIGb0125 TaxID=2940618 RepID=UPI002166F466|nr:hypothetical protein [Rhizobium sp. BIGb0125]MCS4244124.1 hypothetical protein [Rhizobium sp. BIGb0125]